MYYKTLAWGLLNTSDEYANQMSKTASYSWF